MIEESFFSHLVVEPDGSYSLKRQKTLPPVKISAQGKRRGEMNKTERWYRDHVLQPALAERTIYCFAYCEEIGLSFPLTDVPKSPRYTPDFLVIVPDRVSFLKIELHEIKAQRGKWTSEREAARLRMKLAAIRFPQFVWKRIVIERQTWSVRVL